MTVELATLIAIVGLLLKVLHGVNQLDNEVIRTTVKLEYLEKQITKLDRQIFFESKDVNNDNK